MAIFVYPNLSPRLIVVPAADGTEITVQDLVDQLRDWEDEQDILVYDSILNASGKEELGGGVSVGITSELINARLAFQTRSTSVSYGTVTTTVTEGNKLIDSGATFEDDGVTEGATIFNITDKSIATVISIDSQIQITCFPLADGVANQFTSTDEYKIWNEIQCNISGGNMVAIDGAGNPMDPVFPTFGTQIVRTSSSSATLMELEEIQNSSFQNKVSLSSLGNAGTTYPSGTPNSPVNNLADAKTIADSRGFNQLYFTDNWNLGATDDVAGYIIAAPNSTIEITVTSGCNTTGTTFLSVFLQGTLDGNGCAINNKTRVGDLDGFFGFMNDTTLEGTLTLAGVASSTIYEAYCTDGCIIDFNGSAIGLVIRNVYGRIKFINATNAASVINLDMSAGKVTIDSSCTDGTINIHGVAEVMNSATGTTVTNLAVRRALYTAATATENEEV